MRTIKDAETMYSYSRAMKNRGKRIGFVPTMGSLHEGHLSLIEEAKKKSDIVVVSIFVNPTQFGPGEDFKGYPRNHKKDTAFLNNLEVDALFLPGEKEMYGEGFLTSVEVENLSKKLCGKTRPDHFKGVTTVVAKLFNIVDPDLAVFGEKDWQQLLIIKQMVKDLNFPVKIIGLPTVRAYDSVAMSSRNEYLTGQERERATSLHKILLEAKALIDGGEKNPHKILVRLRSMIGSVSLIRLEYLVLADPKTLDEIKAVKGDILVAVAAKVGQTRLIDNLLVKA